MWLFHSSFVHLVFCFSRARMRRLLSKEPSTRAVVSGCRLTSKKRRTSLRTLVHVLHVSVVFQSSHFFVHSTLQWTKHSSTSSLNTSTSSKTSSTLTGKRRTPKSPSTWTSTTWKTLRRASSRPARKLHGLRSTVVLVQVKCKPLKLLVSTSKVHSSLKSVTTFHALAATSSTSSLVQKLRRTLNSLVTFLRSQTQSFTFFQRRKYLQPQRTS